MVLVIDNYDSFTYNLVQYLGELGATLRVRRNDEVSIGEIEAMALIARYHRQGPPRKSHEGFRDLDRRRRKAVKCLAAATQSTRSLSNRPRRNSSQATGSSVPLALAAGQAAPEPRQCGSVWPKGWDQHPSSACR